MKVFPKVISNAPLNRQENSLIISSSIQDPTYLEILRAAHVPVRVGAEQLGTPGSPRSRFGPFSGYVGQAGSQYRTKEYQAGYARSICLGATPHTFDSHGVLGGQDSVDEIDRGP